jgi:hypothetical protein
MTVDLWGVLAVLAPLIVMVFRELVLVRRDAVRRHSLERLVSRAPANVRITDRASDGGVIEIVVDRRARD